MSLPVTRIKLDFNRAAFFRYFKLVFFFSSFPSCISWHFNFDKISRICLDSDEVETRNAVLVSPLRQYLEFFSTWMIALDIKLSPSVSWPDRENMWSTMPQCFQESFLEKKVTVIIDCFEVFINRPSGLYVRTQTISSYKNHYTEKFWLESHLRAVFLLFPKLGVEEHQTNSWLRIVVS